jgi:acyl-CoA reductase-like NAD-dependent aldehyde dehydrogenase
VTTSIENLIDGTWSAEGDGVAKQDLNPADQRDVIGLIPLARPEQAAAAVDAAAAAFPAWRATSIVERGVILSKAADLLRDRRETIAADITRENGKTLREARVEVTKSADFLDYYAGVGRLPYGELLDDVREGAFVLTKREPLGVVVAITPWNDPLLTPARKISPALISGNTLVVKPSTDTPLAMQHLAMALQDAGLPAGVVNLISAPSAVIGSHVLADPRIAAVTLTGSTQTGLGLQKQLAGRNLRFQAEMGGKNAAVVMADADLDLAAATIAAAGFAQAGQRCTATSRVLVQASVRDAFLDKLVAIAGEQRVGPGIDDDTTVGPLVHRDQQSLVVEHVGRARAQGASVLIGGDVPTTDAQAHGCFVNPAVVADVEPSMDLWREEVFGPVIAVATFDSFEQAVHEVNDSPYGLSAAIFTTNLSMAHRFIDEADTGQVAVNLPTSGWDVHHPFGGFKNSGSAFKEQGLEALRFYTKLKTATIGHTRAAQ